MTAISDPEDDFVTRPPRLKLMPQDQDPREITETLAPPTDREAKTNPENEAPETRAAMPPPPARALTESYFAEAAKEFSTAAGELRAARIEIAQGFRSQESKQAERHAETTANAQLVASAIRAHGDRLIALERDAELKTKNIADLTEEIRQARAAADEAVALARKALDLVASLEDRLPNAAGTAQAPAPATPAPAV